MIQRQNLLKVSSYILIKVAGAGFLLFVLAVGLFYGNGFELYEFVEGISNWFLWMIIFGYGVLCSMLIDLIVYRFPNTNLSVIFLLYFVAGFIYFIVIGGLNVYTVIGGSIGAIGALVFYLGEKISIRFTSLRYIFALVVPLLLIILTNFDFTQKFQWNELKNDSSYTATFDYFNGKQEIPIYAKEDQTITFSHDFLNTNGGGHGFYVQNENNEMVGMSEISSNCK